MNEFIDINQVTKATLGKEELGFNKDTTNDRKDEIEYEIVEHYDDYLVLSELSKS